MQKSQKVYIYDKNGELVKVVKDKKSAAKFANTSTSSVTRSITGISTSSHCGYHFRYEGQELGDLKYRSAFGRKPVACKDKNGITIEIYRTQREAAIGQNISQSQICNQMRGRIDKDTFIKKYGVYFEDYDGEIQPSKTNKQQEYLINILVGLVNGTLIDGATYIINNMRFIYNKNEQCLVADGNVKLKRDSYIILCDIEKPLLTDKEKEFITMLKGNMSNIKTITKLKNYNGMEYIRLNGTNIDLVLDEFKEGTQYTGLKLNQVYELDKLGVKTA